MKNTGKCPKCGGKKLIFVPGSSRAYGAGNNIMTGLSVLTSVLVNRYVCAQCGFSEEWIDLEDIPKLEKKYGHR